MNYFKTLVVLFVIVSVSVTLTEAWGLRYGGGKRKRHHLYVFLESNLFFSLQFMSRRLLLKATLILIESTFSNLSKRAFITSGT